MGSAGHIMYSMHVACHRGACLGPPTPHVLFVWLRARVPAGEEGGGKMEPAVVTLLAAVGRSVDSFPADFVSALMSGKVSTCCTCCLLKASMHAHAAHFSGPQWLLHWLPLIRQAARL